MGRPRIDKKEVERRLLIRFPEERFEILEYVSLGQPGKIRCCNCDKIIEINKINNFFAPTKKFGCSDCQSKYIKQREENWEKINLYYEATFIKVTDTHKIYQFKCKKCGYVRETTTRNIMRFFDCSCITGVKRKRTPEEFINEVNQYAVEGFYELVGNYQDQITPVLLRHSCGFIFDVRPQDIIHGRSRCPKCRRKRSKGELLIERLLKDKGIEFWVEKQLDNSKQRFDFYMENEKHKIAIEYNGAQHYVETNFFSTSLKDQQERDNKKKKYCEEKNIKLYSIPYTMTPSEIESYIFKIVDKFND